MLSGLYRCLVWATERIHDPIRSPKTLALSRRAFTRALGLVAFGGLARPAAPRRALASAVCDCDPAGQCQGSCQPNFEAGCPDTSEWWGAGGGANCWCAPVGDCIAHLCDCYCPEDRWKYCVCSTMNSPSCGGEGGGGGHDPGGLL